jgi:formamidopyrimidine-DNA glycosylase
MLQSGFPGVGNWMADEILWRAKLHPRTPVGTIKSSTIPKLWRAVKFVCRGAMRTIVSDLADPPKNWFFHQRWDGKGHCPKDATSLRRATIGGRTTAWCPQCQSHIISSNQDMMI